jgi:hypothetical protein
MTDKAENKDKGPEEGADTKDKSGEKIAVTVNYQQRAETLGFSPSTKVEEVLDWALGKFGIDPAMAGEFELAFHGIPGELVGHENLGRLVKGGRSLALDLVRGDIANGAGHD